MKKLIFIAVLLIPSYCFSQGSYRFKWNHPDINFKVTSNVGYDTLWGNIIDFFSEKGIPIKTMDKSSGLIISEKMSFLNSYTIEPKKEGPIDSSAFIVVAFAKHTPPTELTGEWNIHIRKEGNKVIISVNLVNIKAQNYTPGGSGMIAGSPYTYDSQTIILEAKSTGVFEKTIAATIQKP